MNFQEMRSIDSNEGTDATVLDRRTLNRALLERQMLLRRSDLSASAAIHHLVGMQSQAPNPPYIGLWTRLNHFQTDELSQMMMDREAVRIALMRSTIHLVAAADCLALRPIVQPVLERGLRSNYGSRLEGIDLEAVAWEGRALVEEHPLTFSDIGSLLGERWPERDPSALAAAVRTYVPLVQVPPRGIWNASGPSAHTSAEEWLGRQLDASPSLEDMIARYLAAFGPATVRDIQTWSGLNGLRSVLERLRPRLRTHKDEHGKELFDLPDAPIPVANTPAPLRFVPTYDNILLSHADRTRIISEDHRRRVFTNNGIIKSTVLIDGFVAGTWNVTPESGSATLNIELFEDITYEQEMAFHEEGRRLLLFAAPDAATHDIQIVMNVQS